MNSCCMGSNAIWYMYVNMQRDMIANVARGIPASVSAARDMDA